MSSPDDGSPRAAGLAISYPEIAEMQTRAVIEAAINVNRKHPDYHITPEIMIPLVGDVNELKYVKNIVTKVADEIISASGIEMKYMVGTMIEIPRAALLADEIAEEAGVLQLRHQRFNADDIRLLA